MNRRRVIYRVPPEPHEDVFGYLARVAARNHLPGMHSILSEVLGVKRTSITFAEVSALADFCRLYPEEMLQLSGIVERGCYGARTWRVCGHWVTKEPFVSTRKAKICPACLYEAAFVRGEWTLSFYTSCARHGVTLYDRCPKCRRAISWNRRAARYCSCGFDLATAEPIPAVQHSQLIAQLIGLRSGQVDALTPSPCIDFVEHEKLATLTLDGLCKTLWFLGHCLGELGSYSVAHGRVKPMSSDADTIVLNALHALNEWPKQFGELLSASKIRSQEDRAGTLLVRLLGPVDKYLRNELQDEELQFVRIAYEQHLRQMWRSFGNKYRRLSNERQLELDYGP